MFEILHVVPVETESGIPTFKISYRYKPDNWLIQYNPTYGLLVGSRAGSKRAKMKWRLLLAPTGADARGWDDQIEETSSFATRRVKAHASKISLMEQQGRYAAIRYVSEYGMEKYLTESGGLSSHIEDAQSFTYPEAEEILKKAEGSDFKPDFEGDCYVAVSICDSINASYGKHPMYRRIR
jgi:hypothetical protein